MHVFGGGGVYVSVLDRCVGAGRCIRLCKHMFLYTLCVCVRAWGGGACEKERERVSDFLLVTGAFL